MPRRIDAGELLAALGGLLVLIALFLDWYGIAGGDDLPFGTSATGWEAFESLDLIISALALVAIAVAASSFGAGWPLSPRILLPVGALLTAIIAIQLAEPPPVVRGLELETGAWLGLTGAVLVLIGGALRVSALSITVSTRAREVRPRVSAVDRREAAAGPATSAPSAPSSATSVREPTPRRSLLDDEPQATQPFRPVDKEE